MNLAIESCCTQSLMKLANKKGNEVGPEIVEEIEIDQVNVVSNTKLKVRQGTPSVSQGAPLFKPLLCFGGGAYV